MPCFLSPDAPDVIVPAKWMPGTVADLPEGRLGRQPALAEGRDAERRQVAQRAGEAGRGDDLVGLEAHRQPVVAPLQVDPQAARHLDDPLDRGRQDVDAAAEGRVLERLDVAGPDADERAGLDRRLGRRRRGERDPAGPLEEARRQLEAGVLLAEDEQALPGVRLGRAGVGVVDGQLDAGRRGAVRLGDADGQDQVPAAILAVARDDARTGAPSGASSWRVDSQVQP